MKKLKVVSLFDGISCARVALESLGYQVEYYASEVDKYAIQIAQKNYPDTIQIGDVTKVTKKTHPQLFNGSVDLLIGGSPCQDLSRAGRRKGLQGARSGLFWTYLKLLKDMAPKYFVLENVESMDSESRDIITKSLKVEPILMDAALFSAQRRKRLFWTNITGITIPTEEDPAVVKNILERCGRKDLYLTQKQLSKLDLGKITDLTKRSWKCGKHQQDIVRSSCAKAATLAAATHAAAKHLTKTLMVHRIRNSSIDIGKFIRRLSPVECERLQGLPDGYTHGISEAHRYETLGNGFQVAVVAHILSFM